MFEAQQHVSLYLSGYIISDQQRDIQYCIYPKYSEREA